ncbi:MAG TPA: hypothetical protein G4N93_04875 [Dehalococcoidia bacterium]|nr:hypothetical protein [Dehalococcoidia bacterium]
MRHKEDYRVCARPLASNVPEKQIVVAAGEGAKAALQAHRYLQRLST